MRRLTAALTALILLLTSASVVIFTPAIQDALLAATRSQEPIALRREVTRILLAYFRSESPAPRDYFNARELVHLRDVRGLVRGLLAATALALILLLGLVIRAVRQRAVAPLLATLTASARLNLLAVGVLLASSLFTFPFLFTLFHRVAFRNDLWLLDPTADLLIRVYPESYFALLWLMILVTDVLIAVVLPLGIRQMKKPKA